MVFRFPLAPILALALLPVPTILPAQAVIQPLATSDADALAEQVRRLGTNPLDLDALLTAAELSVRLDDLSAAGSFLARAEKVSPVSARGLAVRGMILVRAQRPGEALRQFGQAEAMGLPAARFAADRGLAYDLTGDQARAQRDYRLALAAGENDETRRRYALSLAIAGKAKEADEALAPLIRRNDRAAWRTRAFVLAMGGDATEALKIAQTMMPPGAAQGLRTFFAELPQLPATDRAFAVHFGEVRANPARLADARLAPVLAPLAEPAPMQVAAVTVAPTPEPVRDKRGRKREKAGRVAIAETPPVQVAAVVAEPVPQPPAYQAPAYQPPAAQAAYQPAGRGYSTVDRPLTPGELASLAAATLKPSQRRGSRAAAAVPSPTASANLASAAGTGVGGQPPVQVAAVTPPPPAVVAAPVAAAPVARAPARVAATVPTPRPGRASRGRSDDILAKIVANLSIPASELGVDKPAVGSRSARDTGRLAAVETTDVPAATGRRNARRAAGKPVVEEEAPAPTAAEKKALAAKKAAADRKALADKKAAAEKKELAAKAAAEKKAARAEPARIWVQVAGGANEGDLAKAWAATKAKAPGAFAGRNGYSTPLRATNRVLTGPFKTDAEARAYVNQLAKSGVSAFSFTSDAGQKVSRLGGK